MEGVMNTERMRKIAALIALAAEVVEANRVVAAGLARK